jgi:hypothetical protein
VYEPLWPAVKKLCFGALFAASADGGSRRSRTTAVHTAAVRETEEEVIATGSSKRDRQRVRVTGTGVDTARK